MEERNPLKYIKNFKNWHHSFCYFINNSNFSARNKRNIDIQKKNLQPLQWAMKLWAESFLINFSVEVFFLNIHVCGGSLRRDLRIIGSTAATPLKSSVWWIIVRDSSCSRRLQGVGWKINITSSSAFCVTEKNSNILPFKGEPCEYIIWQRANNLRLLHLFTIL